ncbi:ComEA family DNA-binding protein [Allostreptomyces psammosilenae]|uniref:Competence protein ComEA n=1 Tax=Allostreptomyces psammosilenae TaxID=1892865 RepID=A0A852ZXA9_9ACTN|nr:ComEA family DNA-binding protein [Allostreptomyces psammosilenae]NYI06655.1 competence protein ComEA [Allostreptomyces psammosilenae]
MDTERLPGPASASVSASGTASAPVAAPARLAPAARPARADAAAGPVPAPAGPRAATGPGTPPEAAEHARARMRALFDAAAPRRPLLVLGQPPGPATHAPPPGEAPPGEAPSPAASSGEASPGGASSSAGASAAGSPSAGPSAPGGPPASRAGAAGRVRRPLLALRRRAGAARETVRLGLDGRSLLALAAVLVVAAALAVHHLWLARPRAVEIPAVTAAAEPAQDPPEAPGATAHPEGPEDLPAEAPSPPAQPASTAPPSASGALVVHVAGRVEEPGVRELPAGSRVADAVAAAGGALPGVDTTSLNLARPLSDGEQILVGLPAASGAPPVAPDGPETPGPAAVAAPVSLNQATAAQLDALPGVGPVLAQRIIDHREDRGGFTSVDELRDVDGIGDQRFAEIEELVRL